MSDSPFSKNETDFSEGEVSLIKNYRKLNKIGKAKAADYLDDLTSLDKYNGSYRVFTAAMSDDQRGMEYTTMPQSDIEKLRTAPEPEEL